MKPLLGVVAASLLALLANAVSAQQWQSAGVSKMTAAYDPGSGAVLVDTGAGQRLVDPQVVQASVYQPPGRAYAIEDRFSATPSVAQPGYGSAAVVAPPGTVYGATPVYAGAPTYAPGMAAPNAGFAAPGYTPGYNGCAPVDPYGCGPVYGQPAPYAAPSASLFPSRPAHAEIEGRMGDPAEVLQGNLMLPFWQQQNVFWFLDLRGQYDDERAGEGNFGVARRELLSSGMITTLYAFYDIRHSAYNNNFQQGMVGFEMMTLDWEYRVNGYLPFSGAQATGLNVATLDVNNNIVVQQGLERAYFGMDAEYGFLLSRPGGQYDSEYRVFLGGYWFDTDKAGYSTIAGPRARIEGRCFDLPYLGSGSRFTYGLSYQWDDVRDSQWIASANLRIPFGAGSRAATKLSLIERRMLSALRRDEAIVTGSALSTSEQAIISSTGAVATNVATIDAGATAAADVAAAGDIVVVANNINLGATGPIALNANQFIGGRFQVHGQDTGAVATFGQQRTVSGNAGADVLQLGNNATITGLRISGGDAGIGGDNVTGFKITNNHISGGAGAGVRLQNISGGDIVGNTFVGGGTTGNGLIAATLLGLSDVRDNSFTGFASDGVRITTYNGGVFSGNSASGNGDDGFQISTYAGGNLTGNTSHNNGNDGFEVGTVNGGVISGNTAEANGDAGFDFINAVTSGSITGNLAAGNTDSGFDFDDVTGGLIRQNTARTNGVDGFQFATLTGGGIGFNTAEANADDGFQIDSFTGGVFSDNTASDNTDDGYDVTGAGGTAAGNTGSGNGANNVFP
ncbi:hypothetical protein Pla123a_33680 [Posidoniimonas polymericola]|uniref:Right handed beta helix domain-containing protein n=1 Tax=Posidoniimonas polymericola TaxID=2528002 RepID=A0A5C5YH36_9BACT|nr:right-handed parallel beta-helix repeat-containing protein [Posidoniimonas polymericola]TWT74544.1 hypothetical protein Pla123a_33680 [Posidoniimonas polymericola]